MGKIGATELRKELAEALNRVAYSGERIVIDRNGKDIAAVVPMADLVRLQKLEEDERKRRLAAAQAKLHDRYAGTFKRLADE